MKELIIDLLDGEERNKAHSTFQIPPAEVRENLKVGDMVKVGFEWPEGQAPEDGMGGERMWLSVTSVEPGPKYEGTLRNHPFVFKGHLKFGDVVRFEPKHVLST